MKPKFHDIEFDKISFNSTYLEHTISDLCDELRKYDSTPFTDSIYVIVALRHYLDASKKLVESGGD